MKLSALLIPVAMLLLAPSLLLAQTSPPTIWVASPWQHVLKTTPPDSESSVNISAARHEYEPFRIIVTAGDEPLTNVEVVASALTGSSGEIAASNIKLFREHYVHIYEPSERSTADPGWYPDPLIPFQDPVTGEDVVGARYDAVPFSVEAGANQGVWVDAYVPPEAPAGVYRGTITVTADSQTLAQVPVTLTVYDLALPESTAMRSWFGTGGLAGFLGLEADSPEFLAAQDLYNDTLLAHRCVPSHPGRIWPAWTPEGGIDDSKTGERLRTMVEDKHVNSLTVPFWYEGCLDRCLPFLHDLEAYLRDKGWLELALIYLEDEPNSAEEYELVREQATLLQEYAPGIKRLCTEQTIPSNAAWGDLYGYVDIWCPLWGLYHEPTAQERQALGEEIWSYTALCQMDSDNPFWQIDFPPVVFRSPFWVSWHYGIKGFLYWSTIRWPEGRDAWTDPDYGHWGSHFWGEGVLLYPGADAGIDGPAPSIRLKLIREAMEDFEYMTLAAHRAGKDQVDPIVDSLARSFTDWERSPATYFEARQQLADLIIQGCVFADVSADNWAFEYVEACVNAGIVAGYPDGYYRPRVSVSRAQMAVFITRALAGGDENVPDGPVEATFEDVPAGYWAYKYIEHAVASNIVAGYSDDRYHPDWSLTRGQMAVFIARAMAWVHIEDDMKTAPELFPDVPAGFWAGRAIQACIENDAVKGYPDGYYRPTWIVSRDQMAVFIARAFTLP